MDTTATLQPLRVPKVLPRGADLHTWAAALLKELLEDLYSVERCTVLFDAEDGGASEICPAIFHTIAHARYSVKKYSLTWRLLGAALALYTEQRQDWLPFDPVSACDDRLPDFYYDYKYEEHDPIASRAARSAWHSILQTVGQLLP